MRDLSSGLHDFAVSAAAGFATFAVVEVLLILVRKKWPGRFQSLGWDWRLVVVTAIGASAPTTCLAAAG